MWYVSPATLTGDPPEVKRTGLRGAREKGAELLAVPARQE